MSDELIVCITILSLSIILAVVSLGYLFAIIAITKMEDYQKNDEKDGPEKG
ncbi:MAG: hypothetical protein K6F00_05060 [Lachnospiraceae bacterium]|nr:hypothetical protein [Lachnospiraceae bacterium]